MKKIILALFAVMVITGCSAETRSDLRAQYNLNGDWSSTNTATQCTETYSFRDNNQDLKQFTHTSLAHVESGVYVYPQKTHTDSNGKKRYELFIRYLSGNSEADCSGSTPGIPRAVTVYVSPSENRMDWYDSPTAGSIIRTFRKN